MNNAIGGVELSSVAKGLESADAMLKTSDVSLLLSRSQHLLYIAQGIRKVQGKRPGSATAK